METKIILAAFNARYAHSSLGARCLLANMGDLRTQTELLEFDLRIQPRTAAEKILATGSRIVSIGCYIWNIDLATRVAALLKILRPDLKIVLGGPEISHETDEQEIFQYADHVICGEGEIEFPKLCQQILHHRDTEAQRKESKPHCSVPQCLRGKKTIQAEPVDVAQIQLPYDLYTDEDIAHRAIYLEASRGCPFRCEYCMSSLDPAVRRFPEEKLFPAFGRLLDRGARVFKFVDRTFNIDIAFALKALHFFRERYVPGMMLHFEVIPSHLPDELVDAVKQCPPGMLQFEVGIQTFNEEVAHRIQRPLDIAKIETNLRRLRRETAVHIHSDLIAGLPGEDLDSFEAGFNRLLALDPQEIQLGILKRLRGAPIDRHSRDWKMVYSPHAPYEILQTSLIPFDDMQRISRFSRYWNLTVNNGQFIHTAPLIWSRRAACGTAPVPQAAGLPETSAVPQAARLPEEEVVPQAAGLPEEGVVPQAARLPEEGVVPQAARLPESTGFNPHRKIHQTLRKYYPHWTQEGCTYFVTFRLADSIPQTRIEEYEELRRKWEEHHRPPHSDREREQFERLFSERVNEWLDEGAGSCCLREKSLAAHVAETILRFDGSRYELDEWVVMPNHVHALIKPLPGFELSKILHTWKSYSSHAINKELGRTGRLWQPESYDHIVRDLAELSRIRNYIRRNPEKAGLSVDFAGSRRAACDTAPVPPAAGLPETSAVPQAARLPEEEVVPQAAGLPEEEVVPQAAGLPTPDKENSPFSAFMEWSDWLYAQTNTTGNLHMLRLAKLLLEFLTFKRGWDERAVAEALWTDYRRGNRPDVPGFLKKFGFEKKGLEQARSAVLSTRQARHLKD